jgi:WD and tetratricopeptide repeat-containing protein 1
MLWRYPDSHSKPMVIDTLHTRNIFGVQFLPCCGDTKLATGAMDNTVQLHELETSPVQVRALHNFLLLTMPISNLVLQPVLCALP